MRKDCFLGLLSLLVFFFSCNEATKSHMSMYSGWKTYGGTKDGSRYSSNDQITINNVSGLKVAWRYSTHDKDTGNRSQIQCNPVVIDGILYGTSPRLKLFAIDASTGKQKWIFDPAIEDTASRNDPFAFFKVSRGVAYWQNSNGADKRIFYSAGSKTFAIDARSGKPVRSFGKRGYIDLSDNLDSKAGKPVSFVSGTTPGIVFGNLIIMGMRVAESADAAPGHIRAYNVITGELVWKFHTIPQPGEFGYETWPDSSAWKKAGGANNWAGCSLDEKRGIIYIPTGSISGDFYGGFRKGTNLFANCLIALNAENGKYLWHYQVVHHDLWDRDLSANPNLVTIHHDGKEIDAVAQITKHGYIFVFDRVTGEPVFPVEEKPVPQNALPGEVPWPTQPFPALPEPFARQQFGADDVTDISPEAHAEMLQKYHQVKYKEMFTPPSKEGSWIFPGFDGGGEWGGASVDPETGIMYVNSTELPWYLNMIDVPHDAKDVYSLAGIGHAIYNKYCIACHGPELKGNSPAYPSLVDLNKRFDKLQTKRIIDNGRNMMPAFKQIPDEEKEALITFLLKLPERKPASGLRTGIQRTVAEKEKSSGNDDYKRDEVPYTMTGYNRFLDKNGYPGIKPPWGTLNAVDLNTGRLLWKVPLGEYTELTKKGIPVTGTENYGGPVTTKGGLVFIAATKDAKIRAFNKKTGKILWEAQLPVPGYATPSTYMVNGKQYLVIACGGGKIGSKSGDEYIAFALP